MKDVAFSRLVPGSEEQKTKIAYMAKKLIKTKEKERIMKQTSRVENNYRAVHSEDGTFSPHISKRTNDRITRYCKTKNKNKTKFVEECINQVLDKLEKDMYEGMSKEELIEILMEKAK